MSDYAIAVSDGRAKARSIQRIGKALSAYHGTAGSRLLAEEDRRVFALGHQASTVGQESPCSLPEAGKQYPVRL